MDQKTLEAFIDAVVNDRAKAREMLDQEPGLLNARYIHNETVLHFLAVEDYVDGVEFLAQAGADVDAVNEFGDTALIDAATLENVDVARVLLRHRANPNATSVVRDNVLDAAARSGNPELVDSLLKAGARADYVTELGKTIWDAISEKAEKQSSLEAVLKKHGIDRMRAN